MDDKAHKMEKRTFFNDKFPGPSRAIAQFCMGPAKNKSNSLKLFITGPKLPKTLTELIYSVITSGKFSNLRL